MESISPPRGSAMRTQTSDRQLDRSVTSHPTTKTSSTKSACSHTSWCHPPAEPCDVSGVWSEILWESEVMEHILRRGSFNLHVFKLDVYTDSAWAGAGYCHSQSSMSSPKQKIIAARGGEAEYYCSTSGMSQGLLFKVVCEIFNDAVITSACCYSAARRIAKRFGVGRIKHLDMRVPWVQEPTASGILKLHTVGTDSTKADLERNRCKDCD